MRVSDLPGLPPARTDAAEELPPVSIVIIGRNESRNLPGCIASIRAMDYPPDRLEVLYVDTDSKDGSPRIARALGVTVYEEHSVFPSAARARNRGWREARHPIVHFVDGDLIVDPGYLRQAVCALGRDGVACVSGRRDERNGEGQLLARILTYPWLIQRPGYVDAPAAGGTFLKGALEAVGGYNADVLRGEETELGMRLRGAGYRILSIDRRMATHSLHDQVGGIRGLWSRYRGNGRSYARVLQLPPSPSLAPFQRAGRRSLLQAIVCVPVLIALVLSRFRVLIALLPPMLGAYVTARYWQPSDYRRLRIAYYMVEYAGKPATWTGIVTSLWGDWRRSWGRRRA